MPSGPKKRRKAAKKLNKRNSHSPSPTIQLQGRNDLESYDNKERAGSEGVSLISHSYSDQNILVEEEKEKERNNNPMEDTSNGKVDETQKVESLDEEKEVVVEEFEREIVIDGNSESVNGTHEDEHNEKLEEEEKEVVDSVEPVVSLTGGVEAEVQKLRDGFEAAVEKLKDDVEAEVEKLKLSDVAEVESNDVEEKTDGVSPVVTDVVLNGIEETPPPSSDVESSGTEETMPPSSDENKGLTPVVVTDVVSKGIEDDNGGVPPVVTDVVPEGTEETKLPGLDENTGGESSGVTDENTVDHSLMGSADSPAATEQGNKREIPETTGNSPIISLSQRTMQPTSWRSCCGLFEVLRRSDR